MKLNVLRMYDDVKMPVYATDGSGCFDIFAHSIQSSGSDERVYGTGLKVELPSGYVMLIYSRSGHGFNKGIRLANCVGVMDSDYRGEIKVKLVCDNSSFPITGPVQGHAVAQGMIVPYEQVEFVDVLALSATDRGEAGFGSTDALVEQVIRNLTTWNDAHA